MQHTKKLPRLFAGLAITAVASLSLAGCAGDVKTQPSSTTAPSAGTSLPPSDGLTIYTGRDKDEVAWVVGEFEKAYPAYKGKVKTVIAGSQELLDRLRAEKGNPQAGFLWGGTQQQFEQAAKESLLAKYKAKAYDAVDTQYKDKDNYWVAEMLLPEVIIYNTNLLTKDTAPQDWSELGDPKWKDKIVIRDVMKSGTMKTIYSSIVYTAFKKDGKPDAGYEALKKLDANTVNYTATPDDMYTQLDQGTGSVTLWNLQDALIQPLKNKRPWGYIMPKSGAPVLTDGVGVVANTKQQQAGQDFMDFLMENKMQAKLAADYYQVPAMKIADADKPQWLKELVLKPADIDWAVFSAHQDEWMKYWADNIKGKGKS